MKSNLPGVTDQTGFMDNRPPFRQMREAIEGVNRILVVSHVDPDGDSLGTQLATASMLRRMGKDVLIGRDGEVPDKYRFLPGIDTLAEFRALPAHEPIELIIVLECPSPSRMGAGKDLIGPATRVLAVDHHRDNNSFGHLNWVDPSLSSVGEMMYEFFRSCGITPNRDEANLLYTAICTDTGRFRYSSTSPRTMQIAGELMQLGADPYAIVDHVYYRMKGSAIRLLADVLSRIEYACNGRLCILELDRESFVRSGADETASEGIVDWTLATEGVLVGLFLKEREPGVTKVSLRSRDSIDIGSVAAQFGGGGHKNAAGCSLHLDRRAARETVIEAISRLLPGV